MPTTPIPAESQENPQDSAIDREELRRRLAAKESFKLVMAVSEWGFRVKHIPGSLRFKSPDELFAALRPDEEIVVYCSNADCHASTATIQKLVARGYRKVRHYVGGLIDWESAGLPVEGDWGNAG